MVGLSPFMPDRKPARPEIQRVVESLDRRLRSFRRKQAQAETAPAFEILRIGLDQLPKKRLCIREISPPMQQQRPQSCRLRCGQARSIEQCGGFIKLAHADQDSNELDPGEGVRGSKRVGLPQVRQSLAEFSSTDVEHAHEDAQTEVVRVLINRLPSGRDCLLEFAASGIFDRLSAQRRDLIHARTYSRCHIGCIDEHRLVARPCRDG